jgi:hypothetical protein
LLLTVGSRKTHENQACKAEGSPNMVKKNDAIKATLPAALTDVVDSTLDFIEDVSQPLLLVPLSSDVVQPPPPPHTPVVKVNAPAVLPLTISMTSVRYAQETSKFAK